VIYNTIVGVSCCGGTRARGWCVIAYAAARSVNLGVASIVTYLSKHMKEMVVQHLMVISGRITCFPRVITGQPWETCWWGPTLLRHVPNGRIVGLQRATISSEQHLCLRHGQEEDVAQA
jgi:hypothetical protein